MTRARDVATALVLVAVCLAPWAFGSVTPAFERALVGSLLAALGLGLLADRDRGRWLALAPAAQAFVLLAVTLPLLQLIPLPRLLLATLAPAAAAVWHPAGAAGEFLGVGPRPVSIHPAATARAWLYLGTLVLLVLRLGPWLGERRRYRFAIGSLGLCGIALAGYAVYARQAFGDRLYGRFAVPTIAPFGPYVSKNHFACWVLCVSLLLFGAALGVADRARARYGPRWTESGSAPAAVALAFALVLAVVGLASGSRGGAVAFTGGLAVFTALRLRLARARRGAVATLVLLTAAAAGTFMTAAPEVKSRLEALGTAHNEASGSFRLDVWRDSLQLWQASPLLGSGVGAFADAFPRYKTGHPLLRVEHPENEYVEIVAEGGVAFAVACFGALFLMLHAAVAAAQACPDLRLRGVAHGALAALGGLGVHSLIDFNLRIPANGALAAVLAALALAPLPTAVRPRHAGVAAAAFFALLFAAVTVPTRTARRAFGPETAGSVARDPIVREVKQLRLKALLRDAVARRPADPESWLLAAWVEAVRGNGGGADAIAAHALALDPQRPGLADAVQRLTRSR